MKYLVEIILENGVTPIYNYYSTMTEVTLDIEKMTGVVDVNVYVLDRKKSIQLLMKAGDCND